MLSIAEWYSFRTTPAETLLGRNPSTISSIYRIFKRIEWTHICVRKLRFEYKLYILLTCRLLLHSRGETYQLLSHNCNNFSNEVAQFLCGVSVPKYILDLPNEILETHLGGFLENIIRNLEQSARPLVEERTGHSITTGRDSSPSLDALNSEVEAARSENNITNTASKN